MKPSSTAALVLWLLLAAGTSQALPPAAPKGEADLADLERRLEELRLKEHSLSRLLERDQTELDQLRRQVIVRGRAYYRLSRGAPRGELLEHAVRVERLRQALLRDLGRARELARQKRAMDKSIAELGQSRAPLEAEQLAVGQARDALLERQERERAFSLAFDSSTGSRDHTAVYSAAAEVDALGQSFVALRGRLPLPLAGRTEVLEVRREFADGPGLVLRGNLGAVARSVFPARVAFADEYPNYGRTVLLDHGDGFFTVTSGLASLDVRAGDELPAGARLGLARTVGAVSEIYLEVRRGRVTLPPGEWFGL
jgi:septal ring factor EnvC (AmiA/AmiB activator)